MFAGVSEQEELYVHLKQKCFDPELETRGRNVRRCEVTHVCFADHVGAVDPTEHKSKLMQSGTSSVPFEARSMFSTCLGEV